MKSERFQGRPIKLHRPLTLEVPDASRSLAHGFRIVSPAAAGSSFWLLAALVAPGCGHEAKIDFKTVTKPPTVQVINPPVRTIVRVVGQPSFIEAYERTSVFPKLTAYIEKWNVDIGDKVKKGETLATLFVPELVEDHRDEEGDGRARQATDRAGRKVVKVAEADVKSAKASLAEAKAILDKFEAMVERWDSEVKRLQNEVNRGVVDPQVLLESTNQLKSSTAAREAAKATISKAEADLLSREATLAKAKVDVQVAQADLVGGRERGKADRGLGGLPQAPRALRRRDRGPQCQHVRLRLALHGRSHRHGTAPHLSPGGAAPIYVVDRTDIVRIFVDIPEQDANYVHIGTKATVLAKGYRDQPIPGSVTRTSWALNVKSRTLRAEIDLPNPNSQLLPGMYAYAKVIIERPGVRALPLAALTHSGEKTYCWKHENGKAVRAEIQTGVSDGEWIEVTNYQLPPARQRRADPWAPVSGSEQVILGDLSILAEGGPVEIVPATEKVEEKVASATPAGSRSGESRHRVRRLASNDRVR